MSTINSFLNITNPAIYDQNQTINSTFKIRKDIVNFRSIVLGAGAAMLAPITYPVAAIVFVVAYAFGQGFETQRATSILDKRVVEQLFSQDKTTVVAKDLFKYLSSHATAIELLTNDPRYTNDVLNMRVDTPVGERQLIDELLLSPKLSLYTASLNRATKALGEKYAKNNMDPRDFHRIIEQISLSPRRLDTTKFAQYVLSNELVQANQFTEAQIFDLWTAFSLQYAFDGDFTNGKLLDRQDFDINSKNADGESPLQSRINKYPNPRSLIFLVANDAPKNIKVDSLERAPDRDFIFSVKDFAKYLLKKGGNFESAELLELEPPTRNYTKVTLGSLSVGFLASSVMATAVPLILAAAALTTYRLFSGMGLKNELNSEALRQFSRTFPMAWAVDHVVNDRSGTLMKEVIRLSEERLYDAEGLTLWQRAIKRSASLRVLRPLADQLFKDAENGLTEQQFDELRYAISFGQSAIAIYLLTGDKINLEKLSINDQTIILEASKRHPRVHELVKKLVVEGLL